MNATATISITTPVADVATAKPRGFAGIKCIHCNEEDAVTVRVADVATFHCVECSEDFGADDVADMLARWQAVLAWVQLAPPAQS
jgi:Zn ribbon nucleic-acid-binding protein